MQQRTDALSGTLQLRTAPAAASFHVRHYTTALQLELVAQALHEVDVPLEQEQREWRVSNVVGLRPSIWRTL